MSKSFTAAAVLQLVEAGRVDLDASVQTYLVAALGGFALAVLVLRTVQLSRLSAWQRRRGRRSPWSALPGIVWLLLPAGLLAAVPALVRAAAAARSPSGSSASRCRT